MILRYQLEKAWLGSCKMIIIVVGGTKKVEILSMTVRSNGGI